LKSSFNHTKKNHCGGYSETLGAKEAQPPSF